MLFIRYVFNILLVLCSSKDKHKYSVVHPKGKIQTQHCVDIVVRHNATSRQNIGQLDKFRIQMFQYGTNKVNLKNNF